MVEHLANSPRVVVLTEGLLVYLSESQVSQLARYLFSGVNVRAWITDLAGPQALWMMARAWGDLFRGARFQFGPANPKEFFAECGWRETEFRSSQEEAQRLGRAPNRGLMNRMVLSAAPARAREELRRLSGVSVLERIDAPVVGSRSAAYPNEDLSSHRGSLLRLAGRL